MNHESHQRSHFESFNVLHQTQEELARHGYFFFPLEKEHTEGLITDPPLRRIRTDIKKRGFAKVAGRVAITFSGYSDDPREIYEIPEARAYWRQLDQQLPELPALLTQLLPFQYNGPGQHVSLLGEIQRVVPDVVRGGYLIHVANGADVIGDAHRRIRDAGRKYRLPPETVSTLLVRFTQGARLPLI